MRRDTSRMRLVTVGECQVCHGPGSHRHHIVPRRITQNDDPENIAVLCHDCHRMVHEKKIDLGVSLRSSQAAKAVLLMPSLHAAHKLLYPSEYRRIA